MKCLHSSCHNSVSGQGTITCKKHKTYDEPNKQPKAHAGLASTSAGKGKSQKPGKVLGTSFPRYFVNKKDDTASESDDLKDSVEHAMFARIDATFA